MKNATQIWLPVIVLLVTISGQWFTVFNKMLDMQKEIATVRVLIAQHLKEPAAEPETAAAVTKEHSAGRLAFVTHIIGGFDNGSER